MTVTDATTALMAMIVRVRPPTPDPLPHPPPRFTGKLTSYSSEVAESPPPARDDDMDAIE